ncbi:MAG: 5' nucleotidase, NT5C type [Bacteroidales bacterium]
MNKKILYLDLDGVVADFEKGIEAIYPDINSAQIFSNKAIRDAKIDAICAENPTIFEHLPLVDGAKKAVIRLFEIYEVYFLSTPMWDLPTSFSGKRIWLEKHFGALAKKRLILTHRKDLNVGDYLVDDRLRNGADKFGGKHIHFGSTEFPDWQSVLTYLELNSQKY